MSKNGYIYALLNVSLEGLVKVGRTSADPEARAAELSKATGVPTPFIVAFKRYCGDTESAERFVHAWLGQKGFRVSERREFFRAPLDLIVDAILLATSGGASAGGCDPQACSTEQITQPALPAEALFEEACNLYFGLGDELQDRAEALKLFIQAARLGHAGAMLRAGEMFRSGDGCAQSDSEAVRYFKQGMSSGDQLCTAALGKFFDETGHKENAAKCWERFINNLPRPNAETAEINELMPFFFDYVVFRIQNGVPLLHLDILEAWRIQLCDHALRLAAMSKERGLDASAVSFSKLSATIERRIKGGLF